MSSINDVAYPLVEQIMPAISRHTHYDAKTVRAIAHVAMTLSEAASSSGLTFVRHEPARGERWRAFGATPYEPKTGNPDIDDLMMRRTAFVRSFQEKDVAMKTLDDIIEHCEPVENKGSYTMFANPEGIIGITSPGNGYFEIDRDKVLVYVHERSQPMIEALPNPPTEAIHRDEQKGHGRIAFHCEVHEHVFADEFRRSDRTYSWLILADGEKEALKLLKSAALEELGPDMPLLKERSYRIELDI